MNDFTKDELEILYQCVTGNRNYQGGQMFPELNSKIQSLIDNYCEHEWVEAAQLDIELCVKCGKREWWENLK